MSIFRVSDYLSVVRYLFRHTFLLFSLIDLIFLVISKTGINVLLESDKSILIHVRSNEKCRDVFLPQVLVNLSNFCGINIVVLVNVEGEEVFLMLLSSVNFFFLFPLGTIFTRIIVSLSFITIRRSLGKVVIKRPNLLTLRTWPMQRAKSQVLFLAFCRSFIFI